MTYAIETERLGMVFTTNWGGKKRALQDLTIQIEENEIVGFLGHNGAGKTTTIKILVGICHQTEGKARIFGVPTEKVAARTKIGFLPEDPYFYEYLTGLESIQFYGNLHGIPHRECQKKAQEILDEVGLGHAMNRRVREFSKGMKQRLGLAQAMIHDPQLLILDEPLSGLDPVGRREVREKIRALKEKGKTVFFSSHVLSDVELLCDRAALLSQGNLVSMGTLDSLLDSQIISVDLVMEGIDEAARHEISPHCLRILSEGKRHAIQVKDEESAQKVKAIAEKHGAILKSLVPNRESLEDYYFRHAQKEKIVEGERP